MDWSSLISPFIFPLCGSNVHTLALIHSEQTFKDALNRFILSCDLFKNASIEDFAELLVQIVNTNAHIPHMLLIQSYESQLQDNERIRLYKTCNSRLLQFISDNDQIRANNMTIKCERAYLIISDLCILNGESESLQIQYRSKIDSLENKDFSHCMYLTLKQTQNENSSNVVWSHNESMIKVKCPMKVALSSANNSDRYGAAKLEGSKVLNMAVNLRNSATGNIQPPIEAFIKCIPDRKLVFEAYNDMTGDFKSSSLIMKEGNNDIFHQFFSIPSDKKAEIANVFTDSNDGFRFYKYALAFSGIVKCFEFDEKSNKRTFKIQYLSNPSLVWEDITKFTGGYGLVLSLSNNGPSKSGFSSSSAVMTTLLTLCYSAMNSRDIIEQNRIFDLALLAENELGLRSGWNDTYAVMPGIHDFITEASDLAPKPILSPMTEKLNTDACCQWLERHLWLIHTGIQRKATGRMNRRHEVYLSRSVETFPYLVKSIIIHDKIVEALINQDGETLGKHLTEYMSYRIAFDPQAINEYLQHLFNYLIEQKLIYGGLLAGAMGGGIAQLIVTDYALEQIPNAEAVYVTRMEQAIETLRHFTWKNEQVFNNLLFGRIQFQINRDGIHTFQ
jgi:galactokinase/mevalonate kinase-like predicted kinase